MYIVINGGGKVGEYLAKTLLGNGHEVAVIELNEKRIEHLSMALPPQALIISGDGCDSVYQADAGCAQADIFVATTGDDDVNLVSCEIAQLVFSVSRTIARINSPKNERIFRRMGIEAVSSTSVISRLIEQEALEGAVHVVMSLSQGNLVITEVSIPKQSLRGESAGVRVADIKLPEGALLVAVSRGETLDIVKGSTMLYPGDVVMVVSNEGLEDEVRDVLGQCLNCDTH
jgi:trk system potassium uptake protein TrkA